MSFAGCVGSSAWVVLVLVLVGGGGVGAGTEGTGRGKMGAETGRMHGDGVQERGV